MSDTFYCITKKWFIIFPLPNCTEVKKSSSLLSFCRYPSSSVCLSVCLSNIQSSLAQLSSSRQGKLSWSVSEIYLEERKIHFLCSSEISSLLPLELAGCFLFLLHPKYILCSTLYLLAQQRSRERERALYSWGVATAVPESEPQYTSIYRYSDRLHILHAPGCWS